MDFQSKHGFSYKKQMKYCSSSPPGVPPHTKARDQLDLIITFDKGNQQMGFQSKPGFRYKIKWIFIQILGLIIKSNGFSIKTWV